MSENKVFQLTFIIFIIIIVVLFRTTNCESKFRKTPIWPCPYNDRLSNLYIDKPDDKFTSLSLFDIYSFTHISHGMILFVILNYIFKEKKISMLFITLGWGILWEIIENTDYVLNKYRKNNILQRDYFGDSLINSIGDIFSAFVGFVIAWNFPDYAIPMVCASEILLYIKMKDNLLTNTIQIFV